MCFKKRNTSVCLIFILSSLAIICGILMIVFTVMFSNTEVVKQMEKESKEVKDGREFVYIALFIFATVSVFTANLGFCTMCVKNLLFYVCFGTLLLPVWIFVIVVGGAALFVSVAIEDKITEECTKVLNDTQEMQGD